MLTLRYDIEFVVSSHDPELRSMSFDTDIAEALLIARRLREGEEPSGRGVFVNLWRAPYRDTDALALVNAINAAAAAPLHRSDGPPIGGIPLFVGGEQWGELLNGPVDDGPWTTARWRQGQTGQFSAALERGELWAADGSRVIAQLPIAPMQVVCRIGPQDRRIRGSIGAFDAYHGWDAQAQFPALWAQSQKVHQGLVAEPNARLYPQAGRDHGPIWSQAGTLQMTRDVRYNSQRVMTTRTSVRSLGIRAWFTLTVRDEDRSIRSKRESALALWCNTPLGCCSTPITPTVHSMVAAPETKACWKRCRRSTCASFSPGNSTKLKPSGATFRAGPSSPSTNAPSTPPASTSTNVSSQTCSASTIKRYPPSPACAPSSPVTRPFTGRSRRKRRSHSHLAAARPPTRTSSTPPAVVHFPGLERLRR